MSHTLHSNATPSQEDELFDIVDEATGEPTGEVRGRREVHALGLYHRAEHTWLLSPEQGELLLQRRAAIKDSWPGRWDISSAGHLSAGDSSLAAAVRELEEELGLALPPSRFRYLFTHLERLASVQKGRPFINNEYNNVYLVVLTPEEREALQPVEGSSPISSSSGSSAATGFRLQESEVSAVAYFPWGEVRDMYKRSDPRIVPLSDWASYTRLFDEVERVCGEGNAAATAEKAAATTAA